MSRDFLKQRLQSLQGEAVNGQPASISSPLGWHGFLLPGKSLRSFPSQQAP